METQATDEGRANDYSLLHLIGATQSDGKAIEYFVCYECLDIVEGAAAATHNGDCPAKQTQDTE